MFYYFFFSSSESGLRNLSALVRLGNNMEIRNYVSLLSSILNRLSVDTEADTHTQRHVRSVLICTLCELESSEQVHMHRPTLFYYQDHLLLQNNNNMLFNARI